MLLFIYNYLIRLFFLIQRPFVCTIDNCEKSFTCKSYLNKHLKRPHNGESDANKREKKKYICKECKKEFKNKFLLKTHFSEHTGIKPFKCEECDAAFALRSRLIRHKKRHRGYPCDKSDCQFVADTWSQLRKHIAVSHKRVYSCNLCSKVLLSKYSLDNHLKAHKFNCLYEDCYKSFIRKCHLNDHVLNEHNTHPFVCDFKDCNQRFTNDLTLYQHKLSHSQNSDVCFLFFLITKYDPTYDFILFRRSSKEERDGRCLLAEKVWHNRFLATQLMIKNWRPYLLKIKIIDAK